jgi:SAM-dependent methyltransferase
VTVFDDPGYVRALHTYRRPPPSTGRRYLVALAPLLARSGRAEPLVLDAGCGGGAFTRPLAQLTRRHGGRVVAMDRSRLMVEAARRTVARRDVAVEHGDLLSADLPAPCAVLWASDVVHVLPDASSIAHAASRLLDRGGAVAIRMSAHAQLRSYEWGAFFPEALARDLDRHPEVDAVCEALAEHGLNRIDVTEVDESRWMSARQYLRMFEARCLSSLRLIDDEQFAAGLAQMRLACHGRRWTLRNARTTLITAVRAAPAAA